MNRLFIIPAAVLMLCAVELSAQETAPKPPYNDYNISHRSMHLAMPSLSSRDIVMLGDSITDRCLWDELLGNPHVRNRGISADRAEWMHDRLDPIVGGHPKKLFLMIGVNDLGAGREPEEVVENIRKIVGRFENESPRTKIYIQSILPYNSIIREKGVKVNPNIHRANELLIEMCAQKGLEYIDIHSRLEDEQGNLDARYTVDGLHLNGPGYRIWADIIRKMAR